MRRALAVGLVLAACNQRDAPRSGRAAIQACTDALARIPGDADVHRLPEPCVQLAHGERCRDALRAADFGGVAFTDLRGACAGEGDVGPIVERFAAPRTKTPPPDASATCDGSIVVSVGVDRAAVIGETTSVSIAPCGTSLDRTALALALCDAIRAARCTPQIVFQAAPGAAHGQLVELMDLAKSAGATRMAIGLVDDVTIGAHPAADRCAEPTPARCP